mmetsp:Transcript_2554/g.5756  ORF Transcript_2554/g.5756 Transcript_2554/m.5756 type:complete len:318 (-) Transcript_2554:63-1016(-)
MMKFVLAALVAMVLTVDAATRVAVIELGASGTVRRTTTASRNEETSVDGVASFWSALHGYGRKLQHAGMPVVPDLFSRPESGVVVGLTGSGVDLDHMPTLDSLMKNVEDQDDERVVGHMQVHGKQCKKMLNNVQESEDNASGSLKSAVETKVETSGFFGMHFDVTSANAASIDDQIASLLKEFASSKPIVLHLIVEEEEGSARRRSLTSRLDGEEQSGAQGATTTQRRLEQEGGEGEGEDNGQNNNNGYYGYGYYNVYGEWVTPYKTMFQIQYFNVVLWTSLGLFAVLFFSIYLMIYMPLMADTLLFGESARVAHDD